MPTLYIPPQGLFFRLLGYQSNSVIVSRLQPSPQVFNNPVAGEYADQYFQLIHGTGTRAGLYAIKGKVSGRVLFSRPSEPHVGHVDGDGQYPDNWFKFEAGTGALANCFRVLCPSSNLVLFSRSTEAPFLSNCAADYTKYDDQYFSFLFEDMTIDRVVYHTEKGKILSSTPLVIADQTLENNTNASQTMEFSVNEAETQSSTFQYTLGFTITVGAKGKAGVPFVSEGEVSVETSNSQSFAWGTTTTTSKSYTARLPVTAPAHTVVRATSSVTRSTLDIPITVYSSSVSAGLKVVTEGKYTGVTTWDLRHAISQKSKK